MNFTGAGTRVTKALHGRGRRRAGYEMGVDDLEVRDRMHKMIVRNREQIVQAFAATGHTYAEAKAWMKQNGMI